MSFLTRGARRAAAPIQSTLDRRFKALEHLIHAVKNEIVPRLDNLYGQNDRLFEAIDEQLAMVHARAEQQGSLLESAQATLAANQTDLAAARAEIGFLRDALDARTEQIAPSIRLRALTGERLTSIDQPASAFLNYSGSHAGPLADAGLWLNPPVVLEWSEGDVSIGAVNERIIEQPFAFAQLCTLPPGARILDIGGGESTVGFSLASMGYDVTVLEPQGYPFEHPNLTVVEQPLEDFEPDASFDAVLLLSAIEHFGIGHYRNNPEADDTADLDAMAIVKRLLRPTGLLVLTTPFGPAEVNDVERIYDDAGLQRLVSGFDITTCRIGVRSDPTTWSIESETLATPAGPGRVAMVTATLGSAE